MKKTILVIEDQGRQNYIYCFDLNKAGFNTLTADTGEKGIVLANTYVPDLILLDVLLPRMDGFQTCVHLKTSEKTRNIPVIIMSALSQKNEIVKSTVVGASYYFIKPFKFEALYNKIVELIGKPES